MARTTDRREFLQLAHVFDPKKHFIAGWFFSEKLDGMRAFWDGGITRGMYSDEIPFANTTKDHIRLQRPKATGLWSRYGKPIQAPMWFLDDLPAYPLDGELTAGRGNFQQTMSTVRKLTPVDGEWENIHYKVFDLPDYSDVFMDGRINVPQWTAQYAGVIEWLKMQAKLRWSEPKRRRFETVVYLLEKEHPHDGNSIVQAAHQVQLPFQSAKAILKVEEELIAINAVGGEGLILRNHNSIWEPQRTTNCLKVKPFEDAEVTVKGFISGKATDRGSKLLGLMGAMIVDFKGKRLELSGFTDEERAMVSDDPSHESAYEWCVQNPGKVVPDNFQARNFPRGMTITIKYRELTNDGLPKEARFYRSRPEE